MNEHPPSIYDRIHREHRTSLPVLAEPMEHRPEALLIGCVDARLDPVEDIGFKPVGTALVYRNIGATVRPPSEREEVGPVKVSAEGVIDDSVSLGAVLEFFINHLKAPEGKKKHIFIAGHTACGGLRAALFADAEKLEPNLREYVAHLKPERERVTNDPNLTTDEERMHAFQQLVSEKSYKALKQFPVVQEALARGELEIHGWILDTGAKRVAAEYDEHTGCHHSFGIPFQNNNPAYEAQVSEMHCGSAPRAGRG